MRFGLFLVVATAFCDHPANADKRGHNPCCSFPCQNRGVCLTMSSGGYQCDCTNTGHVGKNCHKPTSKTLVEKVTKPNIEDGLAYFQNNEWLWKIVNSNTHLRGTYMKRLMGMLVGDVGPRLYNSAHSYPTIDVFTNRSYFARILPPVPEDCPTPLGTVGNAELPDAEALCRRMFTRTKFIPEDKHRTNALFGHFAQYISHMFLKSDYKRGEEFYWGQHSLDFSQLYGPDQAWRDQLRTFKDGKLKSRMINGEEYPPTVKEAPVDMMFKKDNTLVFGHKFYSLSPGLHMLGTLWLREHNRVCDVLQRAHPDWDDERLYQTARLITLGEGLKIALEEYINHLGGFKMKLLFDPSIYFGDPGFTAGSGGNIFLEYDHLYHWHALAPDAYNVGDRVFPANVFLHNQTMIMDYGIAAMLESAVKQFSGKLAPRNHPEYVLKTTINALNAGRRLRFQSFNQYRRLFGLKPYTSFLEFARGDKQTARDLADFYPDVESVEYFIGMMAEGEGPQGVLQPTMLGIGGPITLLGFLLNPVTSQQWWRPSTFGGDVGMQIVMSASLQKLACDNVSPCPKNVGFAVPPTASEPGGLGGLGTKAGKKSPANIQ